MGSLFTKPRLKSITAKNFVGVKVLGAAGATARAAAIAPAYALRGEALEREAGYLLEIRSRPGVTETEAIRKAAVRAVAGSPYVAKDAAALAAPLKRLESARSLAEVTSARADLLGAAEAAHQEVFVTAVRAATVGALCRIGFEEIEVLQGSGDKLRIAAQNGAGRTLVAEIDVSPSREPAIAAEVLGVCHRRADEILDAFDAALEEEGVRASAPPVRKKTGGVAQLEAAREFIRRPVLPEALGRQPVKCGDAGRRAQRLNSSNRQRQR